jgi:hypothetical protein
VRKTRVLSRITKPQRTAFSSSPLLLSSSLQQQSVRSKLLQQAVSARFLAKA